MVSPPNNSIKFPISTEITNTEKIDNVANVNIKKTQSNLNVNNIHSDFVPSLQMTEKSIINNLRHWRKNIAPSKEINYSQSETSYQDKKEIRKAFFGEIYNQDSSRKIPYSKAQELLINFENSFNDSPKNSFKFTPIDRAVFLYQLLEVNPDRTSNKKNSLSSEAQVKLMNDLLDTLKQPELLFTRAGEEIIENIGELHIKNLSTRVRKYPEDNKFKKEHNDFKRFIQLKQQLESSTPEILLDESLTYLDKFLNLTIDNKQDPITDNIKKIRAVLLENILKKIQLDPSMSIKEKSEEFNQLKNKIFDHDNEIIKSKINHHSNHFNLALDFFKGKKIANIRLTNTIELTNNLLNQKPSLTDEEIIETLFTLLENESNKNNDNYFQPYSFNCESQLYIMIEISKKLDTIINNDQFKGAELFHRLKRLHQKNINNRYLYERNQVLDNTLNKKLKEIEESTLEESINLIDNTYENPIRENNIDENYTKKNDIPTEEVLKLSTEKTNDNFNQEKNINTQVIKEKIIAPSNQLSNKNINRPRTSFVKENMEKSSIEKIMEFMKNLMQMFVKFFKKII
ncbi:MAG: hypothetical protein ACMZI2_06555 [Candidatus Symbiodolus clandestinus]